MQITTQLAGRRIKEVWRGGTMLLIRCDDGYELQIGWRNADTGKPVDGEPVILFAGKRLVVHPVEIPHRKEVGL